jgi:hypothetical protein
MLFAIATLPTGRYLGFSLGVLCDCSSYIAERHGVESHVGMQYSDSYRMCPYLVRPVE